MCGVDDARQGGSINTLIGSSALQLSRERRSKQVIHPGEIVRVDGEYRAAHRISPDNLAS